jgi:hypothetical protein
MGAILCGGLLTAASLLSGPAAAALAPARAESPTAILNAATASALAKGSVRVTVHFFSGKVTGELVQDSAAQVAEQTVAIGKERISIVLIGGTAYFVGNTQGLTKYFGLTSALATSMAGRWISVSPSDSGYQSVTAGLSLSAALKEVRPTGSIKEGKRKTVNRQPSVSIAGTGSADSAATTLFIAAAGKPLPIEAVSTSTIGETTSGEIVTFSRWGEKVAPPQPSDAVPIASLQSASTG